jgi:hypothetical protein
LARLFPALIDGVRDSEDRSARSEESFPRHQPGSVFDARYKGLSAQATYIDAGICRQARLRWAQGTPAVRRGDPIRLNAGNRIDQTATSKNAHKGIFAFDQECRFSGSCDRRMRSHVRGFIIW